MMDEVTAECVSRRLNPDVVLDFGLDPDEEVLLMRRLSLAAPTDQLQLKDRPVNLQPTLHRSDDGSHMTSADDLKVMRDEEDPDELVTPYKVEKESAGMVAGSMAPISHLEPRYDHAVTKWILTTS